MRRGVGGAWRGFNLGPLTGYGCGRSCGDTKKTQKKDNVQQKKIGMDIFSPCI